MLNQSAPYKSLDDIILGRDRFERVGTARRDAIDGFIYGGLKGIDVEDGVMFRCGDVDAAFVVCRESCLFGATLAGVLDVADYILVGD